MAVSVKATLTLDTASFSKALKGALTTANLISSAIIGTFNRITGGFKNLAKGIFDAASEMEQFKFSFEALLGSAEKAQKKMAEVAAFSNSTRFDLKDVAEASRNLEILTRGALSGEKGLQLIGDTAAGLQKPFQDVAYAVGELFDTLSKGGDAASELENLRTMGAITQKGAGQINALSKGGPESAAKAWKLATQELEKYKGKAASQSETWEGVTSRFSNAVQNAFRTIGLPLIKALEPAIKQITGRFLALTPIFEKWGKKLADSIEPAVKILDDAFSNPDKMLGAFGTKLGEVLAVAAKAFGEAMSKAISANLSDTWQDFKNSMVQPTLGSGMLGRTLGNRNLGHADVSKVAPMVISQSRNYGKRAFGGQLFGGMGYNDDNFDGQGRQSTRTNLSTKNDAFFGKKSIFEGIVQSAQRAGGPFGAFQNAFSSRSTLGGAGNAFGGSLAIDAKRTTSLLSFSERRRFDMARRAGIRAANGGKQVEGDTLVRRGDRARARAIQKDQLRKEMGDLTQTEIQQEILRIFKKWDS